MKNRKRLLLFCAFLCFLPCFLHSQSSATEKLDEQIFRLTLLSENWLLQENELQILKENLKTAETQLDNATIQLSELQTTLENSQQSCQILSENLQQSEKKLKLWKTLSISFISSTVLTTTLLLVMTR